MYQPSPNCMAAATKAAAAGRVTEAEVLSAFQAMDDYKKSLEAKGDLTGLNAKLKKYAEGLAERTKIAAAMKRRHAALNIKIRKRIDEQIGSMMKDGMRPDKVLSALLAGTTRGIRFARKSLAASVQAFERRYSGTLMARLQKEVPHTVRMLRDKKFDADIMREMYEPGSTKNKDAEVVARIFLEVAEMARGDLNRRGASIGKLDRWAGPQTHDDLKMIRAGKDEWVGYITTKLDVARTFPEGITGEEMANALGDMYDTIISGISKRVTAAEKGQRVNPANLAKSLGASRVLHFKGVEEALQYREAFGHGNTISGMISHLHRSARMAGAMDTLGPNPEVMFTSIAEKLKRELSRDQRLTPKQRGKLEQRLNTQQGTLRHALDIATGLAGRPDSVTAAKIGADIRALQGMAKLGGAVVTSIPSDTVTSAAASQFRGDGFLRGLMAQWGGVMRGRPRGEQAEIAYLTGEGFEGLLGHILSPMAAVDGPLGHMAKWQEAFFRWNGLTWWTDVSRSVASRVLSASMGAKLQKGWDSLKPQFINVLNTHGIDRLQFEALAKVNLRQSNGKMYLTPDRVRELSDADIQPVAQDRLDAAWLAARIDEAKTQETRDKRIARYEEQAARIYDEVRDELELAVLRFFADENTMAIIATDDRSRRTATLGTKAGSPVGEAVRFVMQFKGFPIAFTQRVGGRILWGARKDASFLERAGHFATIMAGLTAAGYMAMVAKDTLKGYWPPRDPSKWETIMAAMQQGGAWGIYGDYLFAAKSRFGADIGDVAVGPAIGNFFQITQTLIDLRSYLIGKAAGDEDARFSASSAFSTLWGNVPFANLFYTKAALDYLFVNSIREWASPGYLRRQARNRMRDYGQAPFSPLGLGPTLQSDLAR